MTNSNDHIDLSGSEFLGPVVGAQYTIDVHLPAPSEPAAETRFLGVPPEPDGFVGREDTVEELLACLDPASAQRRPVVAVAGMPGVGKSALALRVARRALSDGLFSDALYVDFSGCDPDPDQGIGAAQALELMLGAMGVPAEGIPPTVAGRSAVYRSELAARGGPVLIVIDNAASVRELRPLLPGLGRHGVLITSRHTLTGLEGARLVELKALTTPQSMELVATALRLADGNDVRTSQDPDATQRLALLCGRLPLALQVSAAMLKGDRHRPLADLADELEDERTRLKKLKYQEAGLLGVRAAFRVSYRNLPDRQKRVMRLLSHNPRSMPLKPYVTTEGAAILASGTPEEIRPELLALAHAHLLEHVVWERAIPRERWRMHDLVLLYARERARKKAGEDGAGEAVTRFLEYCLKTEFVRDSRMTVVADGRPVGTTEWRDELGDFVFVPAEVHPGVPVLAEVLAEHFEWNDRHRVWVPREQSATGRLAWEVDEARRWGDLDRERAALSKLAPAWAAAGHHQGAEHALRRLAEIGEGDEGGDVGVTTPTRPSPAP